MVMPQQGGGVGGGAGPAAGGVNEVPMVGGPPQGVGAAGAAVAAQAGAKRKGGDDGDDGEATHDEAVEATPGEPVFTRFHMPCQSMIFGCVVTMVSFAVLFLS